MTPVHEAPPPFTGPFRPESLRGGAGFHRAGQDRAGRWWLIGPDGREFFAKSVHGVRNTGVANRRALDAAVLLRRLGFNAVGPGGDGFGQEDGLAFLATVDFCRAAPLLTGPGLRLPDVFAPDWPRIALHHAAVTCAALAGSRTLLGWVTDDALGWAQRTKGGRPSLLQLCLSLEPGFATYHAAWEFVLASHGGRLDALARAWGLALPNREVVRELTRNETGIVARAYARDELRWTREFARRYFEGTSVAIRAADPNHLIFGCGFDGPMPAAIAGEGVPAVDVTLVDWEHLPAGDAPAGPILATNVNWADERFWQSPIARALAGSAIVPSPTRLTSVERMLRRARTALERLARHPAAVGYMWRQWQDEPGEQPPFARGLVHVDGVEAREHTELLAQFNARAEALRRDAGPSRGS